MYEPELSTVYGLTHTSMTMHERFTLLATMPVGWRKKRNPYPISTRNQTMNPEFIVALARQLVNQNQMPFRAFSASGRGRGRGVFHRASSESSVQGFPGLRRYNSIGYISQVNKDQNRRRFNGNFNSRGSVDRSVYSGSGSERSWNSQLSRQSQPSVWGRGRGRRLRNRSRRGRVSQVNETMGARARPARGVGRRGLRRNTAGAQGAPARGWGAGNQWGRGQGRGRISQHQPPKPVPTKEELDAQLDQYMAGTKAALDQQLDEYMRHAMEFE